MNNDNIIYLDLDGVLADFDAYMFDLFGKTFSHAQGPLSRDMWEMLTKINRLYFNLAPTPYCMEIVEAARNKSSNVQILTAIPRKSTIPTAEQDKKDWVRKYLGEEFKVNFGPHSKDKKNWAKPGDILIDDREDNILGWKANGGAGFLHLYTNPEPTINFLNNLQPMKGNQNDTPARTN